MTAPPIPLVWAKLQPPMLPMQAVRRSALLDELTEAEVALTAIVAPPGYGKTTTAAQVVERLGLPFAWVTLEPADSDPTRFWTYVTAAFGATGVEGLDPIYERLGSSSSTIDEAITTLQAAIEHDGRPLVLVLDDVQVIDSEAIHGQLAELLRHPPMNLRVVCTSRRDLPLPVGRLRSQGRLAEARIDRLAFSAREVAAVLDETFDLAPLSDTNLHSLLERTAGWPVGVYLAGIGLRNEADVDAFVARFSGDGRHLSEYLSSEAIDDLEDDRRAFLITTSLVSTLVPDLCDDLTGVPGSLGMLRSLVRDNIFTVALNQPATLFRYHPLFQEHLQSLLAAEFPETVAELHDRASQWYESNGDVDQAITHAADAGRADRACRLIADNWHIFPAGGQLGRLGQWIAQLGNAAEQDTEVSLLMSWVLLNAGRLDEMSQWEQAARDAATTEQDHALCAVEIPTLRSHRFRRLGDVGAAHDAALQAIAVADLDAVQDPGGPPSRLIALSASALTVAGISHYWLGAADDARQLLTEAVTLARSTGEMSAVIQGYCYLALVEADSDNDEVALAHADQVLELVDDASESFHLPAHAHLARSIALGRMGRPADAGEALLQAERLARSLDAITRAAVLLQQARLSHEAGDQAGARQAVRATRAMVAPLPDPRFDDRIRRVENAIRFVARRDADFGFGPVELTDRELAVLALLPHGLSRVDLAAQLHVSENTVKTHLSSIRRKLGLSGRASIVERARELGLLG